MTIDSALLARIRAEYSDDPSGYGAIPTIGKHGLGAGNFAVGRDGLGVGPYAVGRDGLSSVPLSALGSIDPRLLAALGQW